jgi:hypothetical protein
MFLYIGSCRMSHSCDSPLTEDFYKNGKLQCSNIFHICVYLWHCHFHDQGYFDASGLIDPIVNHSAGFLL